MRDLGGEVFKGVKSYFKFFGRFEISVSWQYKV